jgi:hypothetical protein
MNPTEIKKLIIESAAEEADPFEISRKLEDEGVSFDFSSDFNNQVVSRIFKKKLTVIREADFGKSLSTVILPDSFNWCCSYCNIAIVYIPYGRFIVL